MTDVTDADISKNLATHTKTTWIMIKGLFYGHFTSPPLKFELRMSQESQQGRQGCVSLPPFFPKSNNQQLGLADVEQ